jgi:hypothetical protein
MAKGKMPAGLARYMAAKKAGGTKSSSSTKKSGGGGRRAGMNHPKFRARMGNPKGRRSTSRKK